MRNVLLVLEYDGTDFHGFQLQTGQRTVQGDLEAALRRITGESIRVAGAGRTDAGVHAAGQVASFRTASALPTARLLRALNAVLPPDVAVRTGREVPPEFHARFSARRRSYRYSIWNAEAPAPLLRRYTYHLQGSLDAEAMHRAARQIVGTHDFASFAGTTGEASRDGERTTVRTVFEADCRRPGEPAELLEVSVSANAFLPHMMRNLVGTLLQVGSGKVNEAGFAAILAARDRSAAGPTAPARGLCLTEVVYEPSALGGLSPGLAEAVAESRPEADRRPGAL